MVTTISTQIRTPAVIVVVTKITPTTVQSFALGCGTVAAGTAVVVFVIFDGRENGSIGVTPLTVLTTATVALVIVQGGGGNQADRGNVTHHATTRAPGILLNRRCGRRRSRATRLVTTHGTDSWSQGGR